MSKILEAFEKAGNRASRGWLRQGEPGLFALPTFHRTVTPKSSALRKVGWVSALPRPPRAARTFTSLADHLRTQVREPGQILVCGIEGRCGVTASSLNLATEFSLAGMGPVLWIGLQSDGLAMRRLFGNKARYGLLDYLFRNVPLSEIVLRTHISQLSLLPEKGFATPELATLTAEDLRLFLSDASERHPDRWIFIDAPPVTEASLTERMLCQADATVLVVPEGAPQSLLCEAREIVGQNARCTMLFNQLPKWSLLR